MRSDTVLFRLLAVLFAFALLASACGDDDDASTGAPADDEAPDAAPDDAAPSDDDAPSDGDDVLGPLDEATGDPVKVGYANDGTTPAVDHADDTVVAKATVAYINERLGGIEGRPIELVICETNSDPAIAVDCGNQFVEQEVVATITGTSGFSGELYDTVHAAGIPFICAGCAVPQQTADAETSFLISNGLAQTFAFPVAIARREGIDSIATLAYDTPATIEPLAFPAAAAAAYDIAFEAIPVPPGTADMLPQVTAALTSDPGLVQIIGDPAFCLVALRALYEAEYDGIIQTADYCISADTFEPLPPEAVQDLRVAATVAMGVEGDPDWERYSAIMETYGDRIPEVSGVRGWTYQSIMAFALGTRGIDPADITPATVAATMKAAPSYPVPLGGGIEAKCDGSAFPVAPAFCTNAALETALDADANFTEFTLLDTSEELAAIADFMTGG